jgi:hypothetical protein
VSVPLSPDPTWQIIETNADQSALMVIGSILIKSGVKGFPICYSEKERFSLNQKTICISVLLKQNSIRNELTKLRKNN